jgi:hypothetical protein
MLAFSLAKLTFASTPGSLFSTVSMRVAQAAQVMPEIARSSDCGGTLKPAFSMVSTSCGGLTAPASNSTWARSLAKFTAAETPGSLFSCFSMRAAQAAQVMPSMGRSTATLAILSECIGSPHIGCTMGRV